MQAYVSRLFYTALEPVELRSDLDALGWKGGIALETAQHYLAQYTKIYPDKTIDERIHILSRYYAAALARRRLKIRGDAPEWEGNFLDLSFASTPPGTEGYFNRRVTYRTMPSDLTSQHIPPWRAKGYLIMPDGENASPKLASFHDPLPYNHHSVTLYGNNGISVDVQTDYLIA